MDGIDIILNEIRRLMEEFFEEYIEQDGYIRALANHLGVTDVSAVVDIVPEPGFSERTPYPILHFLVTFAKNISEKQAPRIKETLQDLNLAIAIGKHPSFGSFCYSPEGGQIFLDYRLPVNIEAPGPELVNIRYYFRTLYDELDAFADLIMCVCDNSGELPGMKDYLDYLDDVMELDDLDERLRILEERLKESRHT